MPELFNPYIGPRTFSREETERFFGREREARELFSLVISSRLALFYAQSGAGKSSLINTRLIPGLQEAGHAVLPIGRVGGEEEIGEVDNIFVFNLLLRLDQGNASPERFARMRLSDFLTRLTSTDGEYYYYDTDTGAETEKNTEDEPVHVLIIDQFEEIISACPERWEDRKGFFRQLQQAMQDDPLLWVVLTLREDYVAALDPYAPLLASRMHARFYMQRMGYKAALEAIQKPAAKYGRPFVPGVAEQLLDNLRQIRVSGKTATQAGQYVEPVQIQVVCRQLWEKLPENTQCINSEAVSAVGNVDHALADYYAEQVTAIAAETKLPERYIRDWCDNRLITEQGTRGQILQDRETSQGLANAAIRKLVDVHLLREEKRRGATWLELAHDRLIAPIQKNNAQWRNKHLSALQHQAALWDKEGRADGFLLDGEALLEAEAWAESHADDLTTADQAFLDKCREVRAAMEREQRQNRRIRKFAIATTMISMIAVMSLLLAIHQRNLAHDQKDKALLTQSLFLTQLSKEETKKGRADTGRLLALEALPEFTASPDRPYVFSAEQALYKALAAEGKHKMLEDLTPKGDSTPVHDYRTYVTYAAFSHDGRRLATVSDDGAARLWDGRTGKSLAVLTGHEGKIIHVAFSPDGYKTVTASEDNSACIWDANSGKELFVLSGHDDKVWHAAFSPDGRQIATASADGSVRLWEVKTGKAINELTQEEEGQVISVAFNPDGRHLISISSDRAHLWDIDTGENIYTLRARDCYSKECMKALNYAAFSPDGRRAVTASSDFAAHLWNVNTGRRLFSLRHEGPVYHADFNANGNRIITASKDKTARIWSAEVETSEPLSLSGHQGEVTYAAFSLDGLHAVTASKDNTARLWIADSGEQIAVLKGHKSDVMHAEFSPDGERVVTVGDNTARLWEVNSGKPIAVLYGHENAAYHTAFSQNGLYAITASFGWKTQLDDHSVRIWEAAVSLPDKIARKPVAVLQGHQADIHYAAFSHDEQRIITASADHTARLWEFNGGRQIAKLSGHQARVWHAAFSADDRYVATASQDTTARLWNANDGKFIVTLAGHGKGVIHVDFSGNGQVITASRDHTARLWEVPGGKQISMLEGHTDVLTHAAFSPNGQMAVTASADGSARLWDVAAGKLSHTLLSQHESPINHAVFSPDGQWVLTSAGDLWEKSKDNTARLWHADTGKLHKVLKGHQHAVLHAAFSADGKRAVTASADKTARVWRTETGALIEVLKGHGNAVLQAEFDSNGYQVITASADKTVRLWRVFPAPQDLLDYARELEPTQLTAPQRRQFFLEN
ncbi:MAG: hypothetical protein GY862_20605 [Gammaproteobacteria bacterium]|nr:hypothetical protein [Gammaproteobacteria bacterium]